MSIIGRTIIGCTVNSPRLNRFADLSGGVLSSITGNRYQTGRLRVAYQISQQVKAGDKVVFSPGRASLPDGRIIAEHSILNCPETMGEITVRPAFSTPEGMSSFIKHIYLKSGRWGMTFSDEIEQPDRDKLSEAARWTYDVLGIKPDKGISVDIRPLKDTAKVHVKAYLRATLEALLLNMSLRCGFFWSTTMSLSDKLDSLGLGSICLGNFIGLFNVAGNAYKPQERSVIKIRIGSIFEQSTFAHELAHLLASYGSIRNDIIANSMDYLFYCRRNNPNDTETGGSKLDNPLDYLKGVKLWYSYEFPETYQTGTRLGQLAAYLSEQTGDPETKYRFIRMVARHTASSDLIAELQSDPEFRPFFTPNPSSVL